jgi:hypothetical protein
MSTAMATSGQNSPGALAIYFFVMALLWAVGFEGIYAHPTPFYALWFPVTDVSLAGLFRQAFVFLTGTLFLAWVAKKVPALLNEGGMTPMRRRRFLAAMVLFGIVFPCAVAMLREGVTGISQAYAYEYAGDIGKAPSISALFTNYLEIMPYLSMHAKVHPPGPIAFLWLLSYIVTPDPLMLSLATIVVAALAIVPLYYWVRELVGEQVAVVSCLVYACVPSVVLFNATSADALFPVVTLSCLYCFDRALRSQRMTSTITRAALAGVLYGVMTILKFSLVVMGAYFAFAGVLLLLRPESRKNVFVTATVMLAAFLGFHVALWAVTSFDIVAVFHAAKAQFDEDQFHLDQQTPRLSSWIYRILNPMCWFYFAGIPVSLMFYWRLRRPEAASKGVFIVFLLTALVLNLLYLARGEGERSALYLFPFLVVPAAHWLAERQVSLRPLCVVLGFMMFQAWLTEMLFYTYW